jgi:hypothetical protein
VVAQEAPFGILRTNFLETYMCTEDFPKRNSLEDDSGEVSPLYLAGCQDTHACEVVQSRERQHDLST